jgi:deazaflavin-dependent oxidoreductase (nitroreductase family)
VQLPRALARFNRQVTNRVFSPLAGRVPPFAVVEHVGRRSGRRYRTVLWAFPYGPDMVVVLTYGPSADWVRNVLAASSCRVKWAGRWRRMASPEVVDGPAARRLVPGLLRLPLRLAGVRFVLRLRQAG